MFLNRKIFQVRLAGLSVALLLAGMIAGCAGSPLPKTSAGPGIQLQDCQLAAPHAAARLPAKCGALTVYEDQASQSGRQISLHIAVLSALSRTPAPDPLFFITGGPGEAATQDYVALQPAFALINQKRDIVLVDQRGAGQSHPLECIMLDQKLDTDDEAALQTWIGTCVNQMNADTRFYTTQEAVDDLDQVRAALGYDKINLYGVSYGTRVALTYMRSYPEHVRAVILDGVVPQDEALGVTLGSDAQKALDKVLARCTADAGCGQAFPDLTADFAALMQRVDTHPVTLTIQNPTSGEPVEIEFTHNKLGAAIRLFSYSPETVALLPLLIHDAQTTGDLSRLAAQSLIVSQQLEGNINEGLHNSVVCAEDVPFYTQNGQFVGDAEAEAKSYLGPVYLELEKICKYWPSAKVSPAFKEPVKSDAPTLLLSGQDDPVTPPANAAHAAATLAHSLSLVASGQGHGVIIRGCISRVAADFIERGSVEGLDTSCVNAIEPPPFFLSFTGPKP
jgi:pimeloyl-ACP methyl ester carboxylesterase